MRGRKSRDFGDVVIAIQLHNKIVIFSQIVDIMRIGLP